MAGNRPSLDEIFAQPAPQRRSLDDIFSGREPSAEEPETSTLEAIVGKGLQGAAIGYADEIGGALKAGVRKLTGDEGDIGDVYREERDKLREYEKKLEHDSPVASFLAEIGGGFLTPGAGLVKGAKGAAALGAMYGLGKSEADLTKGDVGGAVVDTAIGGAMGGLIHKGGEKLGKFIQGSADDVADAVAARTASPTPRDMLIWKEQPGGVKGVGRSIRESGALKPFQAVDDLAERLDDSVLSTGKQLEAIRGEPIEAEGREVARKLWKEVVGKTQGQTPLRHETAEAKREILQLMKRDLFDKATGEWKDIPLEKLQELKKGYRKRVNFDAQAAAQGGGRKGLMPASQELRARLGSALEKVQENTISRAGGPLGPEKLANYKGLKTAYGNLSQAAGSANRAAARESTKLPLSPYDMGMGAFLNGGGLKGLVTGLGVKAARTRGGTTAAWSLDKIAKFANSPQAGKFGRVLAEAHKRGKPALAATHYVLTQSSPEYRKALETEQDEE